MEIIDVAVNFFREHLVVAAVFGLLTLFLAVRYTKLVLGIVLLLLLLVAAYYGIMSMAGSGIGVKDKLLLKQKKQIEELR